MVYILIYFKQRSKATLNEPESNLDALSLSLDHIIIMTEGF